MMCNEGVKPKGKAVEHISQLTATVWQFFKQVESGIQMSGKQAGATYYLYQCKLCMQIIKVNLLGYVIYFM